MPERAAETRQVPDDTREELIAKAASMWTQERAPAAVLPRHPGGDDHCLLDLVEQRDAAHGAARPCITTTIPSHGSAINIKN